MIINNHPPSSDKQSPGSTPAPRRTLASELCVSAQTDGAGIVAANHCLPGPLPKQHSICGGPRHAMPLRAANSGGSDCPGELNTLPVATTTRSLILANRDRLGYSLSR